MCEAPELRRSEAGGAKLFFTICAIINFISLYYSLCVILVLIAVLSKASAVRGVAQVPGKLRDNLKYRGVNCGRRKE